MSETQTNRTSYHHGDLRRALLDAACELLSESQQWNFSLREVARRANVSHNAPYKHFSDKDDLLGALSARGFEQLQECLSLVLEEASSWSERLRSLGQAYLQFGLDNPARYRLMFGASFSPQNQSAAQNAQNVLDRVVAGGLESGEFLLPLGQSESSATLAAWALVHGLTLLQVEGLAGPQESQGAIEVFVGGLASIGRCPTEMDQTGTARFQPSPTPVRSASLP